MRNKNLLKKIMVVSSLVMVTGGFPKTVKGAIGTDNDSYLNGIMRYGRSPAYFENMENRQKNLIAVRNELYDLKKNIDSCLPFSFEKIRNSYHVKLQNSDAVYKQALRAKKQGEKALGSITEFNYMPYSDGKIAYFKDGLTTKVENERVVDEFGNVSYKNTSNMKYNDKRLLTDYEAEIKDNMGNTTRLWWGGAEYSPNSVFYADDDTNASKNILKYHLKEIDSAGNAKETQWKASEYSGKRIKNSSIHIIDSVYGESSFTRSNIVYEDNNPDRMVSYNEEGVGADGFDYSLKRFNTTYNDKDQPLEYYEEKTIYEKDHTIRETIKTKAEFSYEPTPHRFGPDVETPDDDRILKSTITTTRITPDGAERTETAETGYEYDSRQELIAASGFTQIFGREASWWDFTDKEGHTLMREENREGTIIYTYIIDSVTGEKIVVSEEEVNKALKDGRKYNGTSQMKYEILFGKPMLSQVDSLICYYSPDFQYLLKKESSTTLHTNGLVNNLRRLLKTEEHTEITQPLLDPDNTYKEIKDSAATRLYDSKGNLTGGETVGQKHGWEYSNNSYFYGEYTSDWTIEHIVILGKLLEETYEEIKTYKEVEQ